MARAYLWIYLLSWGTVTAISRWQTYSRPMGPTTFVEMVSSCDAESRNTGWLRYNVLVSGGGSSWTTPCTNNTILKKNYYKAICNRIDQERTKGAFAKGESFQVIHAYMRIFGSILRGEVLSIHRVLSINLQRSPVCDK